MVFGSEFNPLRITKKRKKRNFQKLSALKKIVHWQGSARRPRGGVGGGAPERLRGAARVPAAPARPGGRRAGRGLGGRAGAPTRGRGAAGGPSLGLGGRSQGRARAQVRERGTPRRQVETRFFMFASSFVVRVSVGV